MAVVIVAGVVWLSLTSVEPSRVGPVTSCGTAWGRSDEVAALLGGGSSGLPQRLVSGEVGAVLADCSDGLASRRWWCAGLLVLAIGAGLLSWRGHTARPER
ncbi:hypothetical protein [Actinokineospora globicatena]|uniref:hypothetical protein n=1 Tax=Actinokineospora globicatena TaxID=103729 RepID=UPI0020A562E9|nr:hypothetical protein [Actinokineospora globicatena]